MKCIECGYVSEKVKLTLSIDKKLVEWAKTNQLNISQELETLLKDTINADKQLTKTTKEKKK